MKHTQILNTWWIAVRPFSFPASAMPVIFGTTLAATIGGSAFSPALFLLALVAMLLLHGGSNILNDVCDYKRGLDRTVFPASGAVSRGLLSLETALAGAIVFLIIGSAIGLVIAFLIGWQILVLGVLGVAIGVFYSIPPVGLKYRALGDLAVFLNFGILGALGAWTVQTKELSWLPVIWTIPLSMLVVAILHANNWRDIQSDKNSSFSTVASTLKARGSHFYYSALVLGPFVLVGLFIFLPRILASFPPMPLSFLITFICLPFALKLAKKSALSLDDTISGALLALDAETAKLSLSFGLISTAALLFNQMLEV